MSEPEEAPLPRDQLLREAASWFARMRGPEAEEHRETFEAWLKRGALHRQAYNRAAEIFAMGKLLAEDDAAPAPAPAAPPTGGRSRTAATVVASLIALLALVGAAWLALGMPPRAGPSQQAAAHEAAGSAAERRLETAQGELRTVRLADGTLVGMGSATRLHLALGASERRLRLEQGQARFRVFHDPRPFVVEAGGGAIVALGTVFDVAVERDRRVSVRLIEGAVEVTLPVSRHRPGSPPVRRLGPGESISYAASTEGTPASSSARHGSADSPQDGAADVRDYHEIALAELLAAANRNAERPIRLAQPEIGARLVSGRFRIDDTRLLAERLALLFDLDLQTGPGGGIVLASR